MKSISLTTTEPAGHLGVVSNPSTVHMGEKSAFRPCGRDLVEFFNSTVGRFSSRWITSELLVIQEFPAIDSQKELQGSNPVDRPEQFLVF